MSNLFLGIHDFQQKSSLHATQNNRTPDNQKATLKLNEFQAMDKRIVSAGAVLENFRVNSWGSAFQYKTLNMEGLNSVFLNNNTEFQDCQGMLMKYNTELAEANASQKQIRNGPWRSIFFPELLNLLREVVSTRNREVQAQFVTKVYDWASEQILKLDYMSRKNNESLLLPITMRRPETGRLRPDTAISKGKQDYGKLRPFSSSERRPYSGATGVNSTRAGTIIRPTSGFDPICESSMNITFDYRPESGIGQGPILGSLLEHKQIIQPSD